VLEQRLAELNLVPFGYQHGGLEIYIIHAQNGNVADRFGNMNTLLRFPADRQIQALFDSEHHRSCI
jgi:hypothetical protein